MSVSPSSSSAGGSKGADARGRLVDAATALFAERGFYGASIRDIAQALGVAKATVLHHFPHKHALYAAVLEGVAAELDTVWAAATEGLPPAARLRALVRAYLLWSLEREVASRLVLREILDDGARPDAGGRWYLAGFVNHAAALLRDAQRQGAVHPGSPVVLLEILFALATYHSAAAPTRRRMIGEVASAQADRSYLGEAEAAVERAWFVAKP
jgi:AcrR family transcriptional regulator